MAKFVMGRHTCIWFVVLVVYVPLGSALPPLPYSTDIETELQTLLLTNYSAEQRPQELVIVEVSLTLITINDMNIKDQTLSISGYFELVWDDSRLAWHTLGQYGNIRFLFSNQKNLWRPSLVVDNSVVNLDVVSKPDVPMRILKVGKVSWSPADIYRVSCESDTTYYPMDTQSCIISISSWSYTSDEVVLKLAKGDEVIMDDYSENGEWELVAAYGDKTGAGSKTKGGTSFSRAKFYIQLRRRPLFHILNTLFPVALMAVLSAMVFKLSADSGEKIGFSLTVLLAYAVYLTLISESIPSTSITVCYLSIYLSLVLTLGTLSVLCTIVVVTVYNRSDEEDAIPGWVRSITGCLMAVTCWHGCCRSCNRRKQVCPAPRPLLRDGFDKVVAPVSVKTAVEEVQTDDESPHQPVLTWKVVSRVLDNFFFLVFMTLILLSSIGLFLLMGIKYVQITATSN